MKKIEVYELSDGSFEKNKDVALVKEFELKNNELFEKTIKDSNIALNNETILLDEVKKTALKLAYAVHKKQEEKSEKLIEIHQWFFNLGFESGFCKVETVGLMKLINEIYDKIEELNMLNDVKSFMDKIDEKSFTFDNEKGWSYEYNLKEAK